MLLRRAIAHTVAVWEGRKGGAEVAHCDLRRGRQRTNAAFASWALICCA